MQMFFEMLVKFPTSLLEVSLNYLYYSEIDMYTASFMDVSVHTSLQRIHVHVVKMVAVHVPLKNQISVHIVQRALHVDKFQSYSLHQSRFNL